jgi:hypothetical protein
MDQQFPVPDTSVMITDDMTTKRLAHNIHGLGQTDAVVD